MKKYYICKVFFIVLIKIKVSSHHFGKRGEIFLTFRAVEKGLFRHDSGSAESGVEQPPGGLATFGTRAVRR